MGDETEYYVVAAQVIPVLALVLTVEMRVFDLAVVPSGKHDLAVSPRIFGFVAMILIAGVVVIGEVAALQVLFSNRPSNEAAALVRRGLIFAGLLFGALQLALLKRLLDPLRLRHKVLAWTLATLAVAMNAVPAWQVLR